MMMSSNNFPAIIVVAFNRPKALSRLLKTIAKSNYENLSDIPLIISIDKGDCAETAKIAHDFVWEYGKKHIIEHSKRLGLRKHIISCGDFTSVYSSVIILEDDLLVSPEFYNYAVKAINFYDRQSEISGISLYSYDFNEYAETRFIPLEDGFDNYFLQIPCSWGQAWTSYQWENFKNWYISNSDLNKLDCQLPQKSKEWPETSWKKYFIQYMITNNKYFVYPRISLSTNSGAPGTNHKGSDNFQVSLLVYKKEYRFSNLQESLSIYDSSYEIKSSCLKRITAKVPNIDFECDLYGTKIIKNIESSYLLSIKNCSNPLRCYGYSLIPQELNMIFESQGNFFSLGKVKDFSQKVESSKYAIQLKYLHKNLGYKRYGKILQHTICNGIRKIILGKNSIKNF